MTLTKSILGIVPGLQATALVGHNLKAVRGIGKRGNNLGPKKIVKLGVTNLIGTTFIGATASSINAL